MAMANFYSVFIDVDEPKTEILNFLLEILKSKPVNVSNTALNTLVVVYKNPTSSQDHKTAIY